MRMRTYAILSLMVFLAGCASVPHTTRTGEIHEIRIEEQPSHQTMVIQVGDEIRWINLRLKPVWIEFNPDATRSFSCQKGFSNRLKKKRAYTSLKMGQSASLCFSKNGVYKYNIRMKAPVPGGEIIVPAIINVGPLPQPEY